MLVLTFKRGQKAIAATRDEKGVLVERLQVEVLEMRGGQVKLGFTADPNHVRVHRSKIWERIRTEGERSRKRRDRSAA